MPTTLLLLAALLVAPGDLSNDQPADALRVATFNIRYGTANDGENHWEKRRDLVMRTIERMDADAIGFQEVLGFQLDEMKAALPGYAFLGVGREDGKQGGEFVPVGFKRERFEKLAEGHFWLSETPEVVGSKGWDAALPRIATWVRLKDRRTGKPLLFMNAHFDHKGAKARAGSARLLRERMEALREGAPAVVLGDFNATEDEEPYAGLLGKDAGASRLLDGFRAVHPDRKPDEGTFHAFAGGRTGKRIDWIMHTPEWKATSCAIVYDADGKRYPSDHFPVAATLVPAGAGAGADAAGKRP